MLKKTVCFFSFIFLFCISATTITADTSDVTIEKISDKLYLVTFQKPFMTHSIILETDDGLLLADTGFASTAVEFKNLIENKFNKKVLYIINSHYHADHIGGNSSFPGAIVIAHDKTSKQLTEYYHLPRLSGAGQPNLVFNDWLELFVGGLKVQLRYLPGAPTDGDISVYFPSESVLWLADAIAPDNYTYCDIRSGGDPLKMVENHTIFTDEYPDNTRYFFGHGRELNKNEIKLYHDDFIKLRDIVVNLIKSGKNSSEAAASPEVAAFDRYAKIFPTLKTNWIKAVENSLHKKPTLPSICEPVTKAINENGFAEGLKVYFKLKAEAADKYDFSENQLNTLAYHLMYLNMLNEALEVLELNARMFPASFNVYDSLGEIQMLLGMNEDAAESYKKSLELNPENSNAADKIRELTEKKK